MMILLIIFELSLFFFFLNKPLVSNALNTITTTTFLKDPNAIVSNNSVFKLGFFSPTNNTSKRYVGIWYNKVSTFDEGVIWVANRHTPINDTNGTLEITKYGDFVIFSGRRNLIWSSNISTNNNKFNFVASNKNNSSSNDVHAQLLDTGNLVVLNGKNGGIIWQSFDHPTDTVLPNMQLTVSNYSIWQPVLWSWTSPSNPSFGEYSVGIDTSSFPPQLMMWDGEKPYWRSGPWSGNIFIGMQYNAQGDPTSTGWRLLTINEIGGQNQISMIYSYPNKSLLANYVVNYQGFITQKWWDDTKNKWNILYQIPENQCSIYGKCGDFGYGDCNLLNRKSQICKCLKGFEPKDIKEWNKGNWSMGCVRRTPLKCKVNNSSNNNNNNNNNFDGFLQLENMKVPDHTKVVLGYNEDECRRRCLMICSCLAYSYYSGIGCMSWSTKLIDIVELSSGGATLYLRLASIELGHKSNVKKTRIIAMVGAAVITTTAITICLFWRLMQQRVKKKKAQKKKMLLDILRDDPSSLHKLEELPLFEIDKLASATNTFHNNNKLGEGGFGPAYKGTLEDGQNIAVKRLSTASHQGIQEFMNEVLLISKLQHRNLVKLLGCCVEDQEKMLVYEFMPNKSLDAYLFDTVKKESLDWNKRFCIIEGICRGLLYLHRDSRLKIIHRDLKAGNILLDENFNPKISDFGTARIFGGNQIQADTRRIVGTYGYMPPEYALEGQFSEKSDVFSFGVLLLEIISGKKNQWFDEESLSLLGFAWKMWNEANTLGFIDPVIADETCLAEISKCIKVGLLCVQEDAKARPNISNVISMLEGEIASLAEPGSPGFTRLHKNKAHVMQPHLSNTINFLTVTLTDSGGR